MYFCEACRVKNDWPGVVPSSYGKCEVCGKATACYDIKSSLLPPYDVENNFSGDAEEKGGEAQRPG